MFDEMSYGEYRMWLKFYRACGGFPHETEDVRWANLMAMSVVAKEGRQQPTLTDFMFVNRPGSGHGRHVLALDQIPEHTQSDLEVTQRLLASTRAA